MGTKQITFQWNGTYIRRVQGAKFLINVCKWTAHSSKAYQWDFMISYLCHCTTFCDFLKYVCILCPNRNGYRFLLLPPPSSSFSSFLSFLLLLFSPFSFSSFSPHPRTFFHAFRERGREKEGRRKDGEEDVREKHPFVASCTNPNWGSNSQPRYVPWPKIEPTLLPFMGQYFNQPSLTDQS